MELKQYRKLRKLTRAAFGQLAGITGIQVWRIETGRCFPRGTTIRKIVEVSDGAVTVADHSAAFEAHYKALAEKRAAKAAQGAA